MIDREQFAKALEEIRNLRALLAFERRSHDALRRAVEDRAEEAGTMAARALRESGGRLTETWRRAGAEQAAMLTVLRSA